MTAFFLIGRGAAEAIGPDIDKNETSLLPNEGCEGCGGNEGSFYATIAMVRMMPSS